MTPENIKNYLKSQLPDTEVIVAGINADHARCLGVWESRDPPRRRRCIGEKASTTWQEAAFTLLVHWTDNPVDAEKQAAALALRFDPAPGEIDGIPVISCTVSAPRWAGRTVNRICEYSMDIRVRYKEVATNA